MAENISAYFVTFSLVLAAVGMFRCLQKYREVSSQLGRRIESEYAKMLSAMARHDRHDEPPLLNREELKALQQKLANSGLLDIEAFYRSAHHRCTLQPVALPSPQSVQELVQAWKVLRKRRRSKWGPLHP